VRLSPVRALSILAISCLPAAFSASAQQQTQFSQGFSGSGQSGSSTPAESNAYAAAMSQPNPAVRVAAIQQFLTEYPNSSLRQQAVSQLILARRQGHGTVPGPGAMPAAAPAHPAPAPSVVPVAAPVSQMYAAPRESLLQQPPKPPQVSFAPHNLTVKADNSTLSQILREISGSTGMKVEGLGQDQRIFGSYGPGEPRVVLLSLLEGSGYNVVMIGDTAGGAPRELSLTQRTAGATNLASGSVARNSSQDDDDADQDVQQTPEPSQPQPGIPPNGEPGQPRSPQEIQQELLRLRQQQQQLPPNAPQQ
jgi:hypothetical protein